MKKIQSILQSDINDKVIPGGVVPAGKDGFVYCHCENGFSSPERKFGGSVYENYLTEEMFGTVLFHSGWSGQTVLFDTERNMYAVVLTTRCGDYERAKKNRFEILHQVWRMI